MNRGEPRLVVTTDERGRKVYAVVLASRDEIPPQIFADGTVVYWTRRGPFAACSPDPRKVHPDDEDFCRDQGHYGGYDRA